MANNTNMINKLPSIFQTVTERKFFDATFDQVFSKKNSTRETGFIGRRNPDEFDPINDYYLPEPTKDRTWYQLEPTAVSKDADTLEKTNRYFYDDLVNRLSFFGGDITNHDRIFDTRYYSYAPPIDMDKYVNYQSYYWVPDRIPTIEITGMTDALINEFVIGKASFNTSDIDGVMPDNLQFTNSMIVRFAGTVSYDNVLTVGGLGEVGGISLTESISDVLSVPDYNDLLSAQDYFTMAPNSIDQNAWSRTNRWYHIDTINKSLLATEQSFPDNATRALRPILEFNKNIELFESGTRLLSTVNYFLPNTYGTSIIGNPITSTPYQVGDLFVLPDDPAYVGSVLELSAPGGIMALTMKYQALYNDLIIVVSGDLPVSGGQRGMTYFFDNGEWFESANRKTNVNQPIQFNLYDSDFNVLNDENKYPNNDFSGSEIFMYKLDDDVTASLDSVLNLPIVYNTLGQLSDIVFENRLQSETFNYIIESDILDITGYYYYRIVDITDSSDDNSTWTYQNSWYAAPTVSKQRVVDMEAVFDVSQTEYILSVDPVQYPGGEYDVIVEINGEETHDYTIGPKNGNTVLTFTNPKFEVDDIVNAYSYTYDSLEADARGYFEIPQQLAGNPNNEEVVEQSYGELIPHFVTIMGNQEGFEGSTLGFNNYNDTPRDLSLGTLIVQNDASLLKAMLVSSEDDLDIITATRFANNEYVNFKSKFLKVARQQQIQNPTPLLGVDDIANDIQLNNIFDVLTISKGFSNSFAYSYMIGITDVFTIEDSVIDVSDTWTISVDLTNPKNTMYLYVVEDLTDNGVYDNAKLLLLNVDYTLDYVDGDTVISWINQGIDDMEVTARIYQDAPPAYIPATPTKLGMAPAYIPVLEKDTTFVDPVLMIVGHDGTRTPAWGEINIDESVSTQTFVYSDDATTDPDSRNDVYFELEKRIYNGLNPEFVKLAPPLVDVDIRPGAFRQLVNGVIQPTEINRYSRKEYYGITESYISKWTAENKADFRINEFYDAGNWMTWNYSKQVDTVLTNTNLPGHWKGIFQYYYDTIRPDTHPWEMLGFSIEPAWWEDTYGADTAQMWIDLEAGNIAGEGRTDLRYARPGLSTIMPVDGSNEIRTISDIFNITETDWEGIDDNWVYGDGAPVESSWYNSPEYRFSETEFFYLMRTSVYSEAFWAPDKNKIIKTGPNTNDYQIIRTDTNERNGTSNVLVHAENVDGEITYRSGYQQYISDRILFLGKNIADTFGTKVRNLTVNLGHKMAAFTDKDTMKVRLTSSSTYSDTGDLLIPTNNYDVHLHTGPSIKDYVYSGLIIRTDEGGKFRVYGYDLLYQSFSVLPASSTRQGFQVNQGGTPATFTNFVFGNTYNAGEFVRYNSAFYQAAITHTADSFNSSYWTKQKSLPQTGGVSVTYYPARESEPVLVPYGSVFDSVQDVYDFIIGYGAWLESEGWEFQTVNASNQVENFKHAGNQFLFWVTSNWEPDNTLLLSPGSQSLTLEVADGYPSNVETMSNGVYSILNKYGLSIAPSATTINRSDQVIQCVPNDADTGVYYFRVSAKETEHVVMFDNVTSFNDTVYEPLLQVRQDRLKISCVRTGNWFGKLQAGGYLITNTGLTQNYENIVGSITEYYNTETALDDPDLDLATKHLTGYENKDYMDELEITDDVQFNFYQGFIRQKGTLNAISKILRSDNIQDKEDITFFEEWAFKLSDFGGTEDYVTLELASGFNEVKSNPQIYRLNYEQSETGSVKSVTLFNTVELYAVAPPVTIDAPTPPENYEGEIRNATAVALLGDNKKITSIVVTDPGAGYTTAPRITIGTTTDTGASVFATSQRRVSAVSVEVELAVNKDIAYSIFQPDILHDDLSDSIIDIDIDDNDRCLAKPTDSVVTPMTDVVDYQLPNAGYVHKHDVDYLAFDVTATTELWNGSNIPVENDLIWVAKNTQEDWGVYKVIDNGGISDLELASDEESTVITVDSSQFGKSEGTFALNRRYLNTRFVETIISAGMVIVKTANTEAAYNYYKHNDGNYYLTDLDGNNIVFADVFENEEIQSYYVLENVRYKDTAERDLYDPTTKSWVDSVSNLWTVYSESDSIHRQQEPLIDTELYENALIRDLDSGDTKVRLPVYDPFKGIIVGIADQNISYKTARDPARYNNSDDPRLLNTNKMFDADQVGKLWWDLSNIRYTYYEQPTAKDDIETDTDSLMYRRDNWGKIFPGATADIYEWVESPRPPKQYSGTGTPRSLTDYVKIETYNRSLDAIQAMYYYWVKDVTEITVNLDNRTIPALEVSRYISNPGSMAYRYFAPVQDTGSTVSNIVANSDAILSNTNNAIQVNYKLREDADANHVQWQLLREGDRFSIIPDDYWDKMVDSLVGYTSVLPISGFGSTTTFVPISQEEGILPVPDPNVPENDKFGLSIRPQQTMFDDIFYARKIMYQSVNTLVAPMQLWADRFIGWDDNITSNDYWSYVDWYEVGYDASNTIAKIQVASLDEIYDLTDTLKDGELVKVYPFVPNPETDFYAIYEYIADEEDFKIVRRQNGTFMMLDTIYTDEYSVILRTEIRELLTALADYVFIDEYKVNENLLFFAMVNYSFSEQQNVNWAFKTTYISFVQDGVILQQYPNYQSDVLDEFVSYVSEVKPYHTKLRDSVTVIASATDEAFGTAFDDFIGSFTCVPIDAPFEDPVYPGEMVTHSCKWVNESITEILRTVDITLDYSRVWKTSRDKSAYWYEQTLFNDKYPDRIDYVNTDPDLYNNTIDYYIDPMVTIDGSGTPIGDLTMPWDSTGWDVSEPTTLDGWRDNPGEWDDGIPIDLLNSEGEIAEFSYGWDYSSNITDEDGNPIPPDSIGNLEDFNQETDQLIEGSAFDRVDNTPEEVAILTPNENLVMGMWYAANNEQIITWDADDGDGWDFETEENDPARLPVYLGWDSRVLITGSADLFPIIAYRLHYTPLGYISYIRVSYERSTVLVNSLTPTSGSIEVVNTSKLPEPSAIEPGIVWIGSERIEYDSVDGSTLTNLRRGTQGTTPSSHDELSLVQDGSSGQIVPDAESDAIDGLYKYPTDPQSDPNGVKLAITGPAMPMLVTGKDGVTAERLNSSDEVMTFEPSWFDPWFKKELDGNDELISYVPPGGDISGAIPVVFTNSDQGEFIESLPAEIPTTITGRKIPWMF